MNFESMKFKYVDYAYPTSANAIQFGCRKAGCYVINTWDTETEKGATPNGGFATRKEANEAADKMPEMWLQTFGRKDT